MRSEILFVFLIFEFLKSPLNMPGIFKNRIFAGKQKPFDAIHHLCTVKFLDNSEAISFTFEVFFITAVYNYNTLYIAIAYIASYT